MTKRNAFRVSQSTLQFGSGPSGKGSAEPVAEQQSGPGHRHTTGHRLLAVVARGLALGALAGFIFAGVAAYLAPLPQSPRGSQRPPQSLLWVPTASSPPLAARPVELTALPVDDTNALPVEDTNAPPPAASEATNLDRVPPTRALNRPTTVVAEPLALAGAPETDARLAQEASLIEDAQNSLAAGNAAQVLVTLDAYAALDRTETLDRQAQLLRSRALAALVDGGQHAAAMALARNYFGSYPGDSPAPAAPKLQHRSPSVPDVKHDQAAEH